MAETKIEDLVALASNPTPRTQRSERHEPAEKEEISAVVQGKKQEMSLGRKLRNSEAGERGNEAKNYIVKDVIVPSIIDMLYDAIKGGIDILFFGGTNRGRGGSSSYSYRNSTFRPSSTRSSITSNSAQPKKPKRSSRYLEEVLVESREEANNVQNQLEHLMNRYNQVTVADLYALTGIDATLSDQNWGWFDLSGLRLIKDREGWVISMPAPQEID